MTVSTVSKRGAAMLVGLIVVGCTSVPITSYPKLAAMDPETMALENLELAVRMQDDFGVIKDSAVISVSLVHEETGETLQRDFILDENPEALTPVLERNLKSGYVIRRFKMSEETAQDATEYRALVVAERDDETGDQ